MAEEKNGPYQPGVYVKGDQTRRADTPADAVQAVFDGFSRRSEDGDVALESASVNDNDPESNFADHRSLNEDYEFEQNADYSDDQADVLSDEHFESGDLETAATPDEPSGTPVDETDPNRSFS